MCGICGVLDERGRLAAVQEMNRVQRHRGPDDEGFIFANTTTGEWRAASGADTAAGLDLPPCDAVAANGPWNLALGSRRLAILDLSVAGHMPMSYQDGRLWIVYNGEVYNYRELRTELKALGYQFRSDSDTEVIMAAYAEWGVDCLRHFNGMFAFALWDTQAQRLFCARDRFGIKPFYYFWNTVSFIFASELKSLLQHEGVPRIPNDQAIFDYLVLGLSDHTEQTFFKDIVALPAGHFLLVDIPGKQLRQQRWWQAHINPSLASDAAAQQQEVYAEFACLLEDAIRLRLRSDVPVGSCLSGGLDSSSVVCLANRLLTAEQVVPRALMGEHQKTFTARNREAPIDEYQYSHLMVKATGAEENLVFPDGDALWREVEALVWQMDEPVDSTSQYPQWNVMRLARQRGVTVLLDGQGGDEILAGYYSYLPAYLSQVSQQRGMSAAVRAGWDLSRVGGAPVRNSLWHYASHRLPWRAQQVINAVKPARPAPGTGGSGLKEWQLAGEFLQRFTDRRWKPAGPVDGNGLVGILYKDLTSTNLPKLLRYEDRNSMAFSLETRLPFLDYRLVEMVFSLPLDYRIRNGWSKWLLRRSMTGVLPREICWRRSKLGFPTPEVAWLQQGSGAIRKLLASHRNDDLLNAYLDPSTLQQLTALPDAELAQTPGLWRIVNFTLWLDMFFGRSRLEPPAVRSNGAHSGGLPQDTSSPAMAGGFQR